MIVDKQTFGAIFAVGLTILAAHACSSAKKSSDTSGSASGSTGNFPSGGGDAAGCATAGAGAGSGAATTGTVATTGSTGAVGSTSTTATSLKLDDTTGTTTAVGTAAPVAGSPAVTTSITGTGSGSSTDVAGGASPTCPGASAPIASTPAPAPAPVTDPNATVAGQIIGTGPANPATPSPSGAPNPFNGPTLASCNSKGMAWVPSKDGTAMCGDPLVSWCCNLATALAEFPASASRLTAAFNNYTQSGEQLYNCSFNPTSNKYQFYFFSGGVAGYRMGSVALAGSVPAASPNATACANLTSSQLGLP